MKTQNPYEETRCLITTLLNRGQDAWAERLSAAMRSGSVSTEILGSIRMTLLEFEQSGVPEQLGLSLDIALVCTHITAILKRSGFR